MDYMDLTSDQIEKILGRKEHDLTSLFEQAAQYYRNKTIVITGSMGSLGTALNSFFRDYNVECSIVNVDIAYDRKQSPDGICMDIINPFSMRALINNTDPDFIFHFAADKHAPAGERTPDSTININIEGTKNILSAIKNSKSKLILSSTCKSCNPETVYGASKVIAERLCLNNGHNVARYYNVIESSENVFEIWNSIEDSSQHEVMLCTRFFITIKEALGLTLFAGMQESGRFTINPGKDRHILDIHFNLYGDHGQIISPRRGDRLQELRSSTSENIISIKDTFFEQIINEHDAIL